MAGLTELPSTDNSSLGPDKRDKIPFRDELFRVPARVVNKIRQYLIELGQQVGKADGSTPGSLQAQVNSLIENGTGPRTATIIVGSEITGDTSTVCDFLDPGDGTGLAAALAAAAVRAATLNPGPTPASQAICVDVFLRAGRYPLLEALSIPANVRVIGAGTRQTQIVATSGAGGELPWRAFATAGTNVTVEKLAFVVPELANDADMTTGYRGLIDVGHTGFTARDLLLLPVSGATYDVDAATFSRSVVNVTVGDPGRFLVDGITVDFMTHTPTFAGGVCAMAALTFGEFSLSQNTVVPALIAQNIRNLTVLGTYVTNQVRFDGVASFRCATLDIDGFKGMNVVAPVTILAIAGTGAVYTPGPRLRNIDNVYPDGLDEFSAGIVVASMSAGPACVITDVLFDNVQGKYGGMSPRTTTIVHPQIAAYNAGCVVQDVMLSSVQYIDPTAGPCEAQIGSAGDGSVSRVSASRLRLDSAVGGIVIGTTGSGEVLRTQLTNAYCADLTVNATSEDAQVLACTATGTYTDAGTGTSQSINNFDSIS